jgi:vitamin B12 transporter
MFVSFKGGPFMIYVLFLSAAAVGPTVSADQTLVVTASREAVAADEAPVSATLIARDEIEQLALPMTADLLRLVPGVAVAASGPRGTLTQIRIRGAEANHSLLFLDGIRFNDPAANEARFELITNDAISRLEVVRGPQSALWGSEALGGVIAIDTVDPLAGSGAAALVEFGGLDSARASARFAAGGQANGVAGSVGWVRSDGIDAFGPSGERDGFENRSASLKASFRPLPMVQAGLAAHWIDGESEYDGFDPISFLRTEQVTSENRIGAARAWISATPGDWTISADGSLLDSSNRNYFAGGPLNRTAGRRLTAGGQVSRQFGGHRLTGAAEHEAEDFRARDQSYFGATDQGRDRSLTALVGEWRAEWSANFSTGLAVRHDSFTAFADATTVRASALLSPAQGWRIHAAYGEGIAQPTFYDLYGFFPGSFGGNPALRPERAKSWEAGVRWSGRAAAIGITGFTARLDAEIVDVFDPATFLGSTANAIGTSRRRGLELEADYRPSDNVKLGFNYSFLDADERQVAGGTVLREIRRPRHSGNLFVTGESGPLSWGASAAYVGKRRDTDFDVFPARGVTLRDYLLASVNLAWRVSRRLEAYVRAENALGADYQDVFGYNSQGRTVHAGLRFRLGD